MQQINLLSLSVLFLACSLHGYAAPPSSGVLPRGPKKSMTPSTPVPSPVVSPHNSPGSSPAPQPAATTAKAPALNPFPCSEYLATPSFTRSMVLGDTLYLLVRKLNSPRAEVLSYPVSDIVQPQKESKLESVAAFSTNQAQILIARQSPPVGFVILNMLSSFHDCAAGAASGFTIPTFYELSKLSSMFKPKALKEGIYKVVEAADGRLLGDLGKRQVREVDPLTRQERVISAFDQDHEPLLWLGPERALVTIQRKDNKYTLIRESMMSKDFDARLTLNPTTKLIRSGVEFAALGVDAKENRLLIRELPSWSRSPDERSKALVLDKAFLANDANVVVDLQNNLAAVFKVKTPKLAQWNRVFIFDYASGEALGETAFAADEDVAGVYAMTLKQEPYFFVVLISTVDSSLKGIRLFKVKEKSWFQTPL